MRAGAVIMAALGVFGVVAASTPARADEYDFDNWRHHGWHEHERREQRWREHDRREHEWREHGWRERARHAYGPPPVYVQPGYAPPAAYYAPPPAYYEAPPPRGYVASPFPGVSIGFGFR